MFVGLTRLSSPEKSTLNHLAPMSSAQTTRSPQVELIHSLAEAYKRRDMNLFAKHTHKDFRRFTYPRSLGKSEVTADEWLKEIAGMTNIWTGDGEVSDTGFFTNLFAQPKSPTPQVDVHSFTETPDKVIHHVRPENV